MRELGNLAIICAQRPDVLMQTYKGRVTVQVYRGQERNAFHADWNNDKAVQDIVHELNHGVCTRRPDTLLDNLTVVHGTAPTPIECFIVVHTSSSYEVDAHAFRSKDEAITFVQQDAERVLSQFDRAKPALLTNNWDDTEVFIPDSDTSDMWHIISKDI